jgi:5-methylcytosine-specific restriction endonuclease McrA
MRERTPVDTNRLQCVECGRVSLEGERGWVAHLPPHDEEPEVLIFCPQCDRREFGAD